MRIRIRIGLAFIALLCSVFLMATGCAGAVRPGPNEIMLKIQMDTEEDIGMLVVESVMGEQDTSGGISNADGSMLGRDEVLTWIIGEDEIDDPSSVEDMQIDFTVITDWTEPNMENVYPPQCTNPLEPLALHAEFGETYQIKISGSKQDGFEAELIR